MDKNHVVITVQRGIKYKFRRYIQVLFYKIFGPIIMAKIYYRIVMKKKLNLKNPTTFTEKINWYKIYYCPKNELIIKCSDKYTVRNFLIENGMKEYISEIVAVWDNANEIDWSKLPEKFALKNSNGCGYNIICNDKKYLDEKKTKKLLKKWMKEKFGCYNAEPHYNIGEKCIICEKYIESKNLLPLDYKIHCMNGKPKVIQLISERTTSHYITTYYDINGNPMDIGINPSKDKLNINDDLLEKMIEISEKIASYFPYVRVDFFINKGKIQISELTFSPSAGLKPDLNVNNGDIIMGNLFDLSKYI